MNSQKRPIVKSISPKLKRRTAKAASPQPGLPFVSPERKPAKEALRTSETRYRRLFETAKDGILILDAETGVVIDVNPFLIHMLGFSQEEICGKELWELGFFKDVTANKANFKQLIQKKYIRYENLPLETADGRKFHVEFVSNVYQEDHHAVIQCNIRDITERMRAEELLQESEERYRNLIEMSPEAIAVHQQGKFVYVNPSGEKLIGAQTHQDLIGKPILDIVHPAYRESVIKRIRQTVNGDKASLTEEKFIKFDGAPIDVEVTAIPFTYQGKPATQVVVRDITEQKQAEIALAEERNLLVTLMDNLPDPIYFKDVHSRFIRVNQAFARRLGMNDPAQMIGKTDFDFFRKEHARAAYEDEQAIIRTGQPVVDKEEEESFPDGHTLWVSTTKMPRRDLQGQIVGTFGISHDITEHKQTEEKLRKSETQFRALFEQAAVGVALVETKTGRFLDINQKYCDFLGYSREEMRHSNFQSITVLDDIQKDVDQMALLLSEKISEFSMDKRFLRKDGTVVWGNLTVSPLWKPGEAVSEYYDIGVVQDITALKNAEEALRENEEKLRVLFEQLPIGVSLLDQNRKVVC